VKESFTSWLESHARYRPSSSKIYQYPHLYPHTALVMI
jgi:hypothetical protein